MILYRGALKAILGLDSYFIISSLIPAISCEQLLFRVFTFPGKSPHESEGCNTGAVSKMRKSSPSYQESHHVCADSAMHSEHIPSTLQLQLGRAVKMRSLDSEGPPQSMTRCKKAQSRREREV